MNPVSPSAQETVTGWPSGRLGGVATADHRRHAQFAGDDGGVAGAAATVGDDGRGPFHDRLPVGIGHVGHQYVAGLNPVHILEARDHPRRARTDAWPMERPFGQYLAASF